MRKLAMLLVMVAFPALFTSDVLAASCSATCPNGGSASCSGDSCSATETEAECTTTINCGTGCQIVTTETRSCGGGDDKPGPRQDTP